jgi:hypothetical protein
VRKYYPVSFSPPNGRRANVTVDGIFFPTQWEEGHVKGIFSPPNEKRCKKLRWYFIG